MRAQYHEAAFEQYCRTEEFKALLSTYPKGVNDDAFRAIFTKHMGEELGKAFVTWYRFLGEKVMEKPSRVELPVEERDDTAAQARKMEALRAIGVIPLSEYEASLKEPTVGDAKEYTATSYGGGYRSRSDTQSSYKTAIEYFPTSGESTGRDGYKEIASGSGCAVDSFDCLKGSMKDFLERCAVRGLNRGRTLERVSSCRRGSVVRFRKESSRV